VVRNSQESQQKEIGGVEIEGREGEREVTIIYYIIN
jgi:hypothetical protein